MATGKRNYPNAELVVHENEPKHWFDDAQMAGTERAKKLHFQCHTRADAALYDRWRLFKQGEIFPGVTAIPRHGHTPGHTTFMIAPARRAADLGRHGARAGGADRAARRCAWSPTAMRMPPPSRRKMFDMVATDRLQVTGMHLHFPGFAHLVRRGAAYQPIPAAWEQAL